MRSAPHESRLRRQEERKERATRRDPARRDAFTVWYDEETARKGEPQRFGVALRLQAR